MSLKQMPKGEVQGLRPHADVDMLCARLYAYAELHIPIIRHADHHTGTYSCTPCSCASLACSCPSASAHQPHSSRQKGSSHACHSIECLRFTLQPAAIIFATSIFDGRQRDILVLVDAALACPTRDTNKHKCACATTQLLDIAST